MLAIVDATTGQSWPVSTLVLGDGINRTDQGNNVHLLDITCGEVPTGATLTPTGTPPGTESVPTETVPTETQTETETGTACSIPQEGECCDNYICTSQSMGETFGPIYCYDWTDCLPWPGCWYTRYGYDTICCPGMYEYRLTLNECAIPATGTTGETETATAATGTGETQTAPTATGPTQTGPTGTGPTGTGPPTETGATATETEGPPTGTTGVGTETEGTPPATGTTEGPTETPGTGPPTETPGTGPPTETPPGTETQTETLTETLVTDSWPTNLPICCETCFCLNTHQGAVILTYCFTPMCLDEQLCHMAYIGQDTRGNCMIDMCSVEPTPTGSETSPAQMMFRYEYDGDRCTLASTGTTGTMTETGSWQP